MIISEQNILYLRYLYKQFKNETDAQEKGKKFEEIIQNIAIFNGLRTFRTSRLTEYGEQIDIHILWKRPILVECKSLSNSLPLKIIEQFKFRLSKREPNTIGIIAFLNGLSKYAEKEIMRTQDRNILTFNRVDLEAIILQEMDFETLLEIKMYYCQRGKIYTSKQPKNFFSDWRDKLSSNLQKNIDRYEINYPPKTLQNPYLKNCSDNFGVNTIYLFPLEEKSFLDNEKLYIVEFFHKFHKPNIYDSFFECIKAYDDVFGFSNNTFFGIANTNVNWIGFGLNDFLVSLKEGKKRYKDLPENLEVHDSENIAFMDLGSDYTFYINIYRYIGHGQVVRDIEFFMLFKNLYPYLTQLKRLSSLMGSNYDMKRDFNLSSSDPQINLGLNFNSYYITVEIIDFLKVNTYNLIEAISATKTIEKEKRYYGAIIKNPLLSLPDEFKEFPNLFKSRDRDPLLTKLHPELSEEGFNQNLEELKKFIPHKFIFAYFRSLYKKNIPDVFYLKSIKLMTIKYSKRSTLALTFFEIGQ